MLFEDQKRCDFKASIVCVLGGKNGNQNGQISLLCDGIAFGDNASRS